ncbi:MAG: hypothetical protein KBD15_01835 [Candidatus Magasanikbacteria bacterium]|jgi:hypothetical protein|nr:hypothetical protein [Candidatus Magasanikbacteria bacterium]
MRDTCTFSVLTILSFWAWRLLGGTVFLPQLFATLAMIFVAGHFFVQLVPRQTHMSVTKRYWQWAWLLAVIAGICTGIAFSQASNSLVWDWFVTGSFLFLTFYIYVLGVKE